jgi:hypothetical protein
MVGFLRRAALVACVCAFSASARPAHARQIFCLTTHQCRSPDSLAVLLEPVPGGQVILDANFGMVSQSAQGKWQYTCDDIFTGRVPYHTQMSPGGRVFVPTMRGLAIGAAGCGFDPEHAVLGDTSVYDVAFDPTTPARIWAVVGDPRKLALSTDGGVSFTVKYALPTSFSAVKVAVAPSDPKVIYVGGYKSNISPTVPLVMGVSTDGGETWTLDENASAGVATAQQIADFLGVLPSDPQTVFVMVTNPRGDEIWRSSNKGHGLVKVLTLADAEEWPRGGFAFGPDGKTVYVVGYDPLNTGTQPPGSLYVSHDGGVSWQRRPAAAEGPHFRCIGARGDTLYACGGDQAVGDTFLLGTSTDEGKSWKPLVTLADIVGPNGCVADKCAATASFLSPFRADGGAPIGGAGGGGSPGLPDAGAPVTPDAAISVDAARPPPPAPKDSGCSYGGGSTGASSLLLLLAALYRARRRGQA